MLGLQPFIDTVSAPSTALEDGGTALGRDGVDLAEQPGEVFWPPNRGFAGTSTPQTLTEGTFIDRYGLERGTFVSPYGTPVPARSLAPGVADGPYGVYRVVNPISVQAGTAAPWFGQPGLGTQYELPASVGDLRKSGQLERVNP